MINSFIIAAVSADGFIAKNENHPAMWTSKEDKKRFVELTKRAGVVVMGSRTFSTLPHPLKERLNIVYSRSMKSEDKNEDTKNVEVTQEEPRALLERLEAKGIKEVAICGGSHIYNLFLKAGVVNKIYLTIEPVLFGKGIPIFTEISEHHLELISLEKTATGSILLEYKVTNQAII